VRRKGGRIGGGGGGEAARTGKVLVHSKVCKRIIGVGVLSYICGASTEHNEEGRTTCEGDQ
jgi:hypothetical protein